MVDFFEKALRKFDQDLFNKTYIENSSDFEEKLRTNFQIAVDRLEADKSVAAIDCNYYYDGDDTNCPADIYLCHEFEEGSDEWLFSWTDKDHIEDGPMVYPYLSWTRLELEDRSPALKIVKAYGEAILLAAFIRAVVPFLPLSIPLSFGEQDSGYSIIKPGA